MTPFLSSLSTCASRCHLGLLFGIRRIMRQEHDPCNTYAIVVPGESVQARITRTRVTVHPEVSNKTKDAEVLLLYRAGLIRAGHMGAYHMHGPDPSGRTALLTAPFVDVDIDVDEM